MRLRFVLLGAAAVTLLGLNVSVLAQERLPTNVLVVTRPISEQDQRAIDGYIDFWMDRLQNGSDKQVTEARDRLIEPLVIGGTSDDFKSIYNTALIPRLVPAARADRVIVRLNAMIVITKISGEGSVALIQAGLADPSPGLRYWAAKAIADVASREGFNLEQQRRILPLIQQAIQKESSTAVLTQLLKALGALDIPEAVETLLRSLNERIVFYVGDIEAPYLPVHDAMQKLYIDLVKAFAAGEPVEPAIRGLAQTAYRYMALATQQLNQAPALDPASRADKVEMIRTCDQVLRWAVEDALSPGTRLPEAITNALVVSDWQFIQFQVDRWRRILLAPPIQLTEQDLQPVQQ